MLINIIYTWLHDSYLTKKIMRRIKPSANLAVFFLFFGVATLEAFQTQNWLKACFWVAIGIVFLLTDRTEKV